MRVCAATKILNFLLACFKKIDQNTKCVYEFNVSLANGTEIKPDLFCYFPLKEKFYSIFEFKKRNTTSKEDLNNNIIPQYYRYKKLKTTDLKGYLIPRDKSSKIYLNYIFYKSGIKVVRKIVEDVPLKECGIYLLDSNKKFVEIQKLPNTPNSELWDKISTFSNDHSLWEKIYVPFTLNDILDISGLGGSGVDISRNAGVVITYNFMFFIHQRKIKGEKSTFSIGDFFNYIYKSEYPNLNIGENERKALTGKIRLFLNYISEQILNERGINIDPIIKKKKEGEYQILLRNTDTFTERIKILREKVISYFKQTEITDFF